MRTKTLASTADRTIHSGIVSKPGQKRHYDCAQEGCKTKCWVYQNNDAGCWRVRAVGFCAVTARSAYMKGRALHLPLAMTQKLQDVLAGNCPIWHWL